MGNGHSKEGGKSGKNGGTGGARVVIVSPSSSENWDKAKTRIKFLGVKRNHVTYTKRPQMVEIGKLTKDTMYGGRVKLQRSQTRAVGIADAGEDTMASMTSVNIVTSSAPGEPIIATYRQPTEDDFQWEQRPPPQKALDKVDEI